MLVDTLIQKHNAGLAAQLKKLMQQTEALYVHTHTRWFVSEMLQVFVSGSLQTTDRPDVTVLVAKACVTPLEAAVPGADAQRLCDRGLEVRTEAMAPESGTV